MEHPFLSQRQNSSYGRLPVALNAINARRLPLAPLVFSLVRPLVNEWEVKLDLFPPEGQANPSDVVTMHQAWVKVQKEIAGLMLITMDPDIQKNLEHLGAYDMLKELKTFLILVSLRKEYDGFVQNYNMHSMGKTVTELHAMLKLNEQTLPLKEVAPALHAIRAGRIQKNQKKKSHKAAKGNQGKGKAKMGYAPVQAPPFAPKPKNHPTPKKDNPAKDAICHQCGEVGHWRRNYPIYLAELMK
ncbi:zinc finger, CCHC-type containing protein [Tanacetum coccineum]